MAQSFQPPEGLEELPEGERPTGSVIGNFSASSADFDGGDTLQYHRPHAFALYHGDGGAMVAYGQLMWRIDVLVLNFGSAGGGCLAAGQDAVSAYNAKIPTIGSSTGDAMDPTIPNVYHQLDDYGDVYLYWTTKLDETAMADRVDACWVQVGGSSPSEDELDLVATADTAFSRFNDGAGAVGALSGQLVGTYRVKLGTVKKDELVKQDYASDVYWSTVLLERT
jgi:hypothetical protein